MVKLTKHRDSQVPQWKKSACRKCRRYRFDPWAGKIPWRRKWQSTYTLAILLPGESHRQRSLRGYSPWGHRVRQDWAHRRMQWSTSFSVYLTQFCFEALWNFLAICSEGHVFWKIGKCKLFGPSLVMTTSYLGSEIFSSSLFPQLLDGMGVVMDIFKDPTKRKLK